MTAIFVTHDQYEAMSMSDDVAVMSNGQIVQYGTPEELYHHPKNKEVATFIGKGTYLEGIIHNQVLSTNEGFQLNHSIQDQEGKYGVLIRPEHVHIQEHDHSELHLQPFKQSASLVNVTNTRLRRMVWISCFTIVSIFKRMRRFI